MAGVRTPGGHLLEPEISRQRTHCVPPGSTRGRGWRGGGGYGIIPALFVGIVGRVGTTF